MVVFWTAAFIVCALYTCWEVGKVTSYWTKKVRALVQDYRRKEMPNNLIEPREPWELATGLEEAARAPVVARADVNAVFPEGGQLNQHTLWRYTVAFRPKPISNIEPQASRRGLMADLIERVGTVENIEFFKAEVVAVGRLEEEHLSVYYNTEIRRNRFRLEKIAACIKEKENPTELDYKVLHFFFIASSSYNLQLVATELSDIVPSILEFVPDVGVYLLPAEGTLTEKELLEFFPELQDKKVTPA